LLAADVSIAPLVLAFAFLQRIWFKVSQRRASRADHDPRMAQVELLLAPKV